MLILKRMYIVVKGMPAAAGIEVVGKAIKAIEVVVYVLAVCPTVSLQRALRPYS